jgi:hypothetical protein
VRGSRPALGVDPRWSHDPGCGAASGERAGKKARSGGRTGCCHERPRSLRRARRAGGVRRKICACSTAQRPRRATAARRCQPSTLGNCPRARRATELMSVRARGAEQNRARGAIAAARPKTRVRAPSSRAPSPRARGGAPYLPDGQVAYAAHGLGSRRARG